MALTHRERVLKTLRGDRADRVPCGEFFMTDEFVRAFLQPTVAGDIGFHHYRAVVEQLDLDIASVPFSAGWGALEQLDEDRALDQLVHWHTDGDRYLFALIDGPFSTAVKTRGFNMLLHYIRGGPHLARDLFERSAEEARVVAQAARDAGADAVILGEDIAYNKSTYIAPADLHDLYFPALANAVREMRALGLTVFFHSDGNLNAILGDLAASLLDGIQGIEPEAGMQVAHARKLIGPALTLWGNLGFDFMSAPHTQGEIESAVQALTSPANEGTGGESRFIFGSCAGLVQGMNPETVRQIYRAVTGF
jgi:uroporphyrinogen decarboxylase